MKRFRRAVGLVLAIHAAEHVMLRGPLDIVADEEVEQAVAVVIEPERGGAEGASTAEPGLLRDVDERALAGIAEEAVLADGGDQKIGEPVVVVVRDGDAHAVHFEIEARAFRNVRECAVAIVAIEAQGGTAALVAGPVGAVDQQDVEPAIAIVVEKGAAGAECFGQVFGAESPAVVLKGKAGLRGDVGEAETGVARGGREGQSAR